MLTGIDRASSGGCGGVVEIFGIAPADVVDVEVAMWPCSGNPDVVLVERDEVNLCSLRWFFEF